MIFIERTITIKKNEASIDEPIKLFLGDGNVELQFNIKNNPFKHRTSLNSTYARLMIHRPTTYPVFSEPAKVTNNKVLFIVTADMIDEINEVGEYDFQITMFNNDQSSKATLPPVSGGIIIDYPICSESLVGMARVGMARVIKDEDEEEYLPPFDSEGNYIRTDWEFGDKITEPKLDKIEEALDLLNQNKSDINHNHDDRYLREVPPEYITEDELEVELEEAKAEVVEYVDDEILKVIKKIPTKVSQLENDANYTTVEYVDRQIINVEKQIDDLEDYVDATFATKTQLSTQIAQTRAYIDSEIEETTEYIDSEITKAKLYTDKEVAGAKSYTDTQVTTLRGEVNTFKSEVRENYALKSEIPTKVSELENDVPYATLEDLTIINEALEAINNGTTPSIFTLAYSEESGNLAVSGTSTDGTNLEI